METRRNTRVVTAPEAASQDWRSVGAITRGPKVEITVDGQPLRTFQGENLAAALLAAGRRICRTTRRRREPRGVYCGIGICFDCLITVDGQPSVRACQTPVRAGMRVDTQSGDGAWTIEP